MTITEYLNKQAVADDASTAEALSTVVEAVGASIRIIRGLELYLACTQVDPLDSMTLSFSIGFMEGQRYAEIHQLERLIRAKDE